MSSVMRFDQFTIYIYPDDHPPPHFHVVGRGFSATIRLSDLSLSRGRLPPGILAQAVTWAAENLDELRAAWETYNARD